MISNYAQPVNELPDRLRRDIVKDALKVMENSTEEKPFAAFDADGTIWLRDASEVFLDYKIENQIIKLPQSPWEHYHSLKAKDPRDAFAWLAQVFEGNTVDQVQQWAKDSFIKKPLNPFRDIELLFNDFQNQGIEVWIVTASVKWPVAAAIELYGLPVTGVLGVETKVVDEKITSEKVFPITWREGKAEAIQKLKKETRPIFCAGNTPSDVYLMELSQTSPLAVHGQKEDTPLGASERKLQSIAKDRGWRAHTF